MWIVAPTDCGGYHRYKPSQLRAAGIFESSLRSAYRGVGTSLPQGRCGDMLCGETIRCTAGGGAGRRPAPYAQCTACCRVVAREAHSWLQSCSDSWDTSTISNSYVPFCTRYKSSLLSLKASCVGLQQVTARCLRDSSSRTTHFCTRTICASSSRHRARLSSQT